MTSLEERQKQNYSPYNYAFALLIFMPRFDNINFYQNRPRIRLFFQKNTKFLSAWGSAPRPPQQSSPLQNSAYAPGCSTDSLVEELEPIIYRWVDV